MGQREVLGQFCCPCLSFAASCMAPDWQLFALNLHVQALVRGWIFGATTATKAVNLPSVGGWRDWH